MACQTSQSTQTTGVVLTFGSSQPSRVRSEVWRAIATLVALTVVLRVPGLNRPLVGHFATKNATYAMIARNWAMGRAPFWLPTTDCAASDARRGLHLLEIPLAAYVAGAGWAICGGSLDVWGRAVSIAFSTAGVALLFLLMRRWHGTNAAWAAALVLALSPVSILLGQSFMLESSLVFFMLAALWCTETWLLNGRKRWMALSAVSVACLLATKIYMLVLLLPLAALLGRRILQQARWLGPSQSDAPVQSTAGASLTLCPSLRHWILGAMTIALVGMAPAIAWCCMALRIASPEHPLSAQVFDSLYRSTAVHQIPNPLLLTADFYLRMLKNLAGVGLTPIGFALAAYGACRRPALQHLSWLAALGVLVALLPGKFFELRYYTLVLIPALAVLAGLGWQRLASRLPAPRLCGALCLLASLACSLRLSVGPAFITPREDRAVTEAAEALRELPYGDAPVATLHGAASDLLYYCDRPGWALSANDRALEQTLDRCRRQGARWLVVADLASIGHQPAADALARLPVVREGDDYRIYPLRSVVTETSFRSR
jgi:4-amino-4-deoxy-L-arabinose transferase-like glycosyltransferase